jgi:hypothetical protein
LEKGQPKKNRVKNRGKTGGKLGGYMAERLYMK